MSGRSSWTPPADPRGIASAWDGNRPIRCHRLGNHRIVRRQYQRPHSSRDRIPAKAKILSQRSRSNTRPARRARAAPREEQATYAPPEDWHEPQEIGGKDYKIVVQPAGDGFMHVVTPQQIRDRLRQLPSAMLEPLEVVQLSRMTRKKQAYPLYGMQWGNALYLYPIESELIEYFDGKPDPPFYNEARMYGGRWEQYGNSWQLQWTPETIRNYYLNNILIHELGHLLDDRRAVAALHRQPLRRMVRRPLRL